MNWKLYREIEGLSILKSAWCFINYALNGVVKHFVNTKKPFLQRAFLLLIIKEDIR